MDTQEAHRIARDGFTKHAGVTFALAAVVLRQAGEYTAAQLAECKQVLGRLDYMHRRGFSIQLEDELDRAALIGNPPEPV